ncbi:MAG: methyl-accepting chemotaxis protein [Lachnospiraceae bacterium]|nr:methyl-accepting chemotaxis protein [Lachnospiraceae bacterium]
MKKKQGSIRPLLISIMVLLVVIPLAISTVFSAVSMLNMAVTNADEVNMAQASIIEEKVNEILNKNFVSLKAFASSPSTIAYLKGEANSEADGEAIIAQLQRIDAALADGNSTAMAGADGMQVLRSKGNLVDVSDREYCKEALKGNDYISDMNISKTTGACISTFATPIFDTDGKTVIGMVQRNYDLTVLHEMLAEEVTQNRQEFVMVDRTGTVVAHSLRELNPEDPEKQDQNPFYTDSRGDKTSGSYSSEFMGDTWIISWVKIPACEWIIASCRVKEVALASVNANVIFQVIVSIIFVIVGVIIAVFFAKSIQNPMAEIEGTLSLLAEGEFRKEFAASKKNDEPHRALESAAVVTDKLKHTIYTIKSEAASVTSSADELSGMADQMAKVTEEVSVAVQNIASGAARQVDEIGSVRANVTTVENAIADVESSAEDLKKLTTRMQAASDESADSLQKLKESSENMNTAICDVTEKISATSQTVSEINEMVDSITSIASQTNLLALNASIEAARAGDAGKGFAVVAEEIGKLADESSESAEKIRKHMDALLQESQSAVEVANSVQTTNNEQQDVIRSTFESVSAMINDVKVSAETTEAISRNAAACSEAKDSVKDAMDMLSEISEENANESTTTGASAEELAATVQTLANSAASLKNTSDNLIREISFFKE